MDLHAGADGLMPLRSFSLLVASALVATGGCKRDVTCVRACGTNVTLRVAGTSDLTAVDVDPACLVGRPGLRGRAATFTVDCPSFGVEVRTANGGVFKGAVSPTVTVAPANCECGVANVEVVVASGSSPGG